MNYNPFFYRNKKSSETTIGEALKSMLEAYKLEDKLLAIRISEIWREKMGKLIANKTLKIDLRKDELIVKLESAVLRKEIKMNELIVMKLLNDHIGKEVIKKLVVK